MTGRADNTDGVATVIDHQQSLRKIVVFAERILPSTQTFIPAQIKHLRRYSAIYAGLVPAERNFQLEQRTVLLRNDRSIKSRIAREAYRWTGFAPAYHQTLRAEQASLVHAHFSEGASAALFLCDKLDLPLIIHLHGGAELMTESDLWSRWYEWPFLAFRRRMCERTALFLCVSNYIREKALKTGFPSDKLEVLWTGIDTKAFSPLLPVSEKDPDLVLYIGRLVSYKGCDFLIRAMRTVTERHPKAKLVIIGDGYFRPTLEALARQSDIDCRFLGELRPVDIRSWLEKARVLCGPSITLADGQSEAFGIVFIEAQAMGVPVVGFRSGGIPETMLDGITGLLAEERDIEGLAQNILRYLKEASFWQQSRESGMRWVQANFDISVQTSKLEKIYSKVIDAYLKTRI